MAGPPLFMALIVTKKPQEVLRARWPAWTYVAAAILLVPPASMTHVEQIAGNLEKMPPKSTYFYPKLLSGLVFNLLKGN